MSPVFTGFFIYVLAFSGWAVWHARRRKKGRLPLGKDVKLLRSPGGYLEEQIELLNERLFDSLAAGVLLPPLIFCGLFVALGKGLQWGIPPATALPLLVLIVLGTCVSIWVRQRRFMGTMTNLRNHRLGLLGERTVAQYLGQLAAHGYHIYHDLPAEGRTGSFNLDHVVVGPSGLFVVETKTRRKPNAEAQNKDHKVVYDGKSLRWPQAAAKGGGLYEDKEALQQVQWQVDWLEKLVQKRLNLRVTATPVLVVPGWWIERQDKGPVRVVNEKELPNCIRGKSLLDTRTVDLIQRLLDNECRTVPFE